jgi:hypothetical protein
MKIDTSNPRIPLHRLKHPVKEKLHPLEVEAGIEKTEESAFSETFERELLQKGAKKFKEQLEKFKISGIWNKNYIADCNN